MGRIRASKCFELVVFTIVFLAPTLAGARTACQQTTEPAHCHDVNGHRECRIDQPPVSGCIQTYPDIEFKDGDFVVVTAAGEVNVDKRENRWLSYVSPCTLTLSAADHLYHGLIWIPGAVGMDGNPVPIGTDLVPISSVAGVPPCRLKLPWQPNGRFAPLLFRISYLHSNSEDHFLRLSYQGEDKPTDTKTPKSASPAKNRYANFGYESPGVSGCGKHTCASVTISIYDKPPFPTRRDTTQQSSSFDVEASTTDLNGFLMAPQWSGIYRLPTVGDALGTAGFDNSLGHLDSTDQCNGFQYRNPWLAVGPIAGTCTREVSFDGPKHIVNACLLEPALGRVHGHVNWAPATYIGTLAFHEQTANLEVRATHPLETLSLDGDFDLHLRELSADDIATRFSPAYRPSGAASDDPLGTALQYRVEPILTQDSQSDYQYRHLLQLEFAEKELRMLGSRDTAWGDTFDYRQLKDHGTKKLFDLENSLAIVHGLLNLDCVHDCHTEVHPVLAIAILKSSDKKIPQADDNTWLIFARDRGDEGSCAQDIHYLDRDKFVFYLPRPADDSATGRTTVPRPQIVATLKSTASGLQWSATADDGGVRFTVPLHQAGHDAEMPVGVSGSVQIKWYTDATEPYSGPIQQTTGNSETIQYAGLFRTILGYFVPVIGPNLERIWFHNAGQWPLGIQGTVASTSLFSVRGEVEWALPRTATSNAGNQYVTHSTLWLAGVDLGLGGIRSWPNLFLPLSLGKINRSADPKNPLSPPFEHFRGKDGVFSYGLGYTFRPARNNWFSVRVVVSDLYVPSTNDHAFRLTVSPQFRVLPAVE